MVANAASSGAVISVVRTAASPKTARIGSSVPAARNPALSASVCLSVTGDTPSGRVVPAVAQGAIPFRATAPVLSLITTVMKLQVVLSGTPVRENAILPALSATTADDVLSTVSVDFSDSHRIATAGCQRIGMAAGHQ